jgi:hypothetical protein
MFLTAEDLEAIHSALTLEGIEALVEEKKGGLEAKAHRARRLRADRALAKVNEAIKQGLTLEARP